MICGPVAPPVDATEKEKKHRLETVQAGTYLHTAQLWKVVYVSRAEAFVEKKKKRKRKGMCEAADMHCRCFNGCAVTALGG